MQARPPVTFSCSAKRKVTKEKAAPVSRAVRVPCAACLTSAAVELGLPSRKRLGRPQTVLADTPEVKRAARRDTGAPTAQDCGAERAPREPSSPEQETTQLRRRLICALAQVMSQAKTPASGRNPDDVFLMGRLLPCNALGL